MNTPDLPASPSHPAGDADPVAALLAHQAAEVAALRARLRDLETALGLPARPGRPAPPTLPALLHRVAALERHAGLVPGLAPLPAPSRPARDPSAPVPASRALPWRDRLPAAGALASLIALLLWLMHPGLPAGHGRGAAADPTAPAVSATTSAGQPAFSQGYSVPGPFDFREDHRQGVIEALPGETDAPIPPTTTTCGCTTRPPQGSDQFTYREDHRQPVSPEPAATPDGR